MTIKLLGKLLRREQQRENADTAVLARSNSDKGLSSTGRSDTSGAVDYAPTSKSFTGTSLRGSQSPMKQQQQDTRLTPTRVQYKDFGQFKSRTQLYSGSVSTVYRAQCRLTGCKVIVKTYSKAKLKTRTLIKVQREIELQKQLAGEGVVQLYSSFEDENNIYLVMELCEGGDLFKRMLLCGGKVDEHWACTDVIVPMLRVLVRLHSQHVIHRDIKPENIFLSGLGAIKLGDFGLAIQCSRHVAFNRSGTLDYMAPEVLANPPSELFEKGVDDMDYGQLAERGIAAYDEKVDIWAMGVLAYELVVGRPPFEKVVNANRSESIVFTDNIPFPKVCNPLWRQFVSEILLRDPTKRPDAQALLQHPWIQQHMRRVGHAQPDLMRVKLAMHADQQQQPESPKIKAFIDVDLSHSSQSPLGVQRSEHNPHVPLCRKPSQLTNPVVHAQPMPVLGGDSMRVAQKPMPLSLVGVATPLPPASPSGCPTPLGKPGFRNRVMAYFTKQT